MNRGRQRMIDTRIQRAYQTMAAFQDAPKVDKPLLYDFSPEEQFKVNLVAWSIERLRRMGRSVDAAWLMHTLMLFCAPPDELHQDIDAFIQETVLGRRHDHILDEVEQDDCRRMEFIRITDAFVALLGSTN